MPEGRGLRACFLMNKSEISNNVDYIRGLDRAVKEDIKIIGRFTTKDGAHKGWAVQSKDRCYFVAIVGKNLVCNCAARGYCKHRAIVTYRLLEIAERRQSVVAQEAPHEVQQVSRPVATGEALPTMPTTNISVFRGKKPMNTNKARIAS